MSYALTTGSGSHLLGKSSGILQAVAFAIGCAASVQAQDIVRPSLTRSYAPDNRKYVGEEPNYNIRVGSISLLMDASVFAEFNDNINLSSVNKQSDIIVRPSIGVTAKWELSDLNSVTLHLGAGYAFYLNGNNGGGSGFTLEPGSELAVNLYSGDFKIRIYDSFSLTDTPIDSVGYSNVDNFGQFSNTAGIAVTWQLSDIAATVGYSHNNIVGTSGNYDYLDSVTDQIYGNVYYAINPTWGVGIEGACSATRYDQNIQNDATGYNLGVFVEGTLTENFSFRAAAGYQAITFDRHNGPTIVPGLVGSLGNDTTDFGGIYANLGFTHTINQYVTQELTIGREGLLGVNSNYIDLFYVRHTTKWNIIKDVDLITRLFYEKATESGSINAEDASRYGASIGASYQIAPSWILSGEYGYIKKNSNLDFRDYTQNRILIGVTYQF